MPRSCCHFELVSSSNITQSKHENRLPYSRLNCQVAANKQRFLFSYQRITARTPTFFTSTGIPRIQRGWPILKLRSRWSAMREVETRKKRRVTHVAALNLNDTPVHTACTRDSCRPQQPSDPWKCVVIPQSEASVMRKLHRLAVGRSVSRHAPTVLRGELRVIDSSVISITLSRNMNGATCITDATPIATPSGSHSVNQSNEIAPSTRVPWIVSAVILSPLP